MNLETWFEKSIKKYKNDPLYMTYGVVIETMGQVCNIMNKKGITRKDLSQLMGLNIKSMQSIFEGRNFTIKTLCKIAIALGYEVKITFIKARE